MGLKVPCLTRGALYESHGLSGHSRLISYLKAAQDGKTGLCYRCSSHTSIVYKPSCLCSEISPGNDYPPLHTMLKMYMKVLLLAAAIIFFSSHAATVPRQNSPEITDAHVASIRTWGAPGCPGPTDNQGESSFGVFDLNICFLFPADLTAESIMVQNLAGGDQILCNGRHCAECVWISSC